MFYCEKCATKNKWPQYYGLPMSRGKCEVCGRGGACFDAPARHLRDLEQRRKALADGKPARQEES